MNPQIERKIERLLARRAYLEQQGEPVPTTLDAKLTTLGVIVRR
jgi:hypothetical protein